MTQHEMRRKDKQVTDRDWMNQILARGQVIHIAMAGEDGWPYLVAMSYGYEDGVIYLHGAPRGKKNDMLAANPKVCFQVVLDVEVVTDEDPSKFTMKYRSVTGFGEVSTLTDSDEKHDALRIVVRQYNGPYMADLGSGINNVWAARLNIDSLTGKSSIWPHP